MNEQVEDIQLDMRLHAGVLQCVERDPAGSVDRYDFAVDKRIGREFLARLSDLRESTCELPRRDQSTTPLLRFAARQR